MKPQSSNTSPTTQHQQQQMQQQQLPIKSSPAAVIRSTLEQAVHGKSSFDSVAKSGGGGGGGDYANTHFQQNKSQHRNSHGSNNQSDALPSSHPHHSSSSSSSSTSALSSAARALVSPLRKQQQQQQQHSQQQQQQHSQQQQQSPSSGRNSHPHHHHHHQSSSHHQPLRNSLLNSPPRQPPPAPPGAPLTQHKVISVAGNNPPFDSHGDPLDSPGMKTTLSPGAKASGALKSPQQQSADNNNANSNANSNADNSAANAENTPVKYIVNPVSNTTYVRGKLLGKGGFARCYELIDASTKRLYAGKIIPKSRITKPHQREKIAREIELHSQLRHHHVVEFHCHFEDDENIYIILENCPRKSLVHVLKARQTLTEPEVRYFVKQLVDSCKYMHAQKVIHRDLKLGNMFLNESMDLKVGDFGLATRVDYVGEKKTTVCGTPNYISPEVLQKKGHSYEVDIWAIGCIVYALLVGRPPFETTSLKETYSRITSNKYHIPSHLSSSSRDCIQRLLAADPLLRPSLDEILKLDFMNGFIPKTLPTSCCSSAPKWPMSSQIRSQISISTNPVQKLASSMGSLHLTPTKSAKNAAAAAAAAAASQGPASSAAGESGTTQEGHQGKPPKPPVRTSSMRLKSPETLSPKQQQNLREMITHAVENSSSVSSAAATASTPVPSAPPISDAQQLHDFVNTCLEQMPKGRDMNPSPVNGNGITWVSKWVDYSNKYGFGYQLSDRSVGVLFNDNCRMTLSSDAKSIQYLTSNATATDAAAAAAAAVAAAALAAGGVGVAMEESENAGSNAPPTGSEESDSGTQKSQSFAIDSVPKTLERRVTLLKYFAKYMDDNLIRGGDLIFPKEPTERPLIPFMRKWFRTTSAIVMLLSNKTLQINFFEDHTKLILTTEEASGEHLLTYINEARQASTFRLLQLAHYGCCQDLIGRLEYARSMLRTILDLEEDESSSASASVLAKPTSLLSPNPNSLSNTLQSTNPDTTAWAGGVAARSVTPARPATGEA